MKKVISAFLSIESKLAPSAGALSETLLRSVIGVMGCISLMGTMNKAITFPFIQGPKGAKALGGLCFLRYDN